jgi:hypothetical protein
MFVIIRIWSVLLYPNRMKILFGQLFSISQFYFLLYQNHHQYLHEWYPQDVVPCLNVLLSRQTKTIVPIGCKTLYPWCLYILNTHQMRYNLWMSYVQTSSRWIRKHVENIVFWFFWIIVCCKCFIVSPIFAIWLQFRSDCTII